MLSAALNIVAANDDQGTWIQLLTVIIIAVFYALAGLTRRKLKTNHEQDDSASRAPTKPRYKPIEQWSESAVRQIRSATQQKTAPAKPAHPSTATTARPGPLPVTEPTAPEKFATIELAKIEKLRVELTGLAKAPPHEPAPTPQPIPAGLLEQAEYEPLQAAVLYLEILSGPLALCDQPPGAAWLTPTGFQSIGSPYRSR
jgi:hypothetical protein